MGLFSTAKKAIILLGRGEWRELYVRALLLLGILDFKNVEVDELNLSPDESNPYSDTGREYLQNVLATLNINNTDAIVDFGSGKGGALITLADYPFAKITGIELSGELLAVAEKNLRSLGIKNVNMVCCDARDFINIDEYNYFYFFNPFPCKVMSKVIENINHSMNRKPREVTIIYLNPVCHAEVTAADYFKKIAEYDHLVNKFYIYSNAAAARDK